MKAQHESAPLRDSQIRSALRSKLHSIHAKESNTAIIDELSLCQGDARVDVAVLNGSFSGYEIKSDRDTLARLPHQLAVYEVCFDTMTIVVGTRHIRECSKTVPEWWGIWEAISTADGVRFESRREPQINKKITPDRVVQLLWRNETFEALKEIGIIPRRNARRRELWGTLVAAVSPERLFEIVRSRIRARGDWRSAPTPFRCDGSSRSAARSQHSRVHRHYLLSLVCQRLLD